MWRLVASGYATQEAGALMMRSKSGGKALHFWGTENWDRGKFEGHTGVNKKTIWISAILKTIWSCGLKDNFTSSRQYGLSCNWG